MTDRATTRKNQGPFSEGDLPIDSEGRAYHLRLTPEQIASHIITVGDPGRAKMIAETFLKSLEVEQNYRGLYHATGTARNTGQRVSIITSGMGTSSLEIVLNELVILNEINFSTRKRKEKFSPMSVIRVGTSGGLQEQTQLGTKVITSYALGLDNSGFFYDSPPADQFCTTLESDITKLLLASKASSRFSAKLQPYASKASPTLVEGLVRAAKQRQTEYIVGMTATGSGFFAGQGRDINRVASSWPNLDRVLADYRSPLTEQKFENFEMEASLLLHFLGSLDYHAACICVAIANREQNTFCMTYEDEIKTAVEIALEALAFET